MSSDAVSPELFRRACALFPTGVAVLTTRAQDGTPHGLTINAFCSLSLTPPLVLVAIDRSSNTLEIFEQAGHFAINFLSKDQRDLSVRFSQLPEGPAQAGGAGWMLTQLPAEGWLAVALFSVGTLCLGMGNGAVFQLLPQRFRGEVGVMTGLVGFAGGLGGFFLAKALATSKGMTGGFMAGFLFFSLLALFGVAGLTFVKHRWRTTWGAVSGARI